ncbi:MAG: protein BatD [Candidatus Kapaibacterium sp.]|nr:MAG: protein BatD [Candidatus Kapabacteria bacterium]
MNTFFAYSRSTSSFLAPIIVFCAVCLFVLAPKRAVAQEITAIVQPNPITVGERFQVSFTSSDVMTNFRAPSFEGFTLLNGPMQSQSMQIVNGATTRSISYTYILQAKSEGKFTIQAASADVAGRRAQSPPVTVNVLKISQVHAQQQQEERTAEAVLMRELQKGVYLKASVNKTSVLRGEQIVATYKLYTRLTLTNYTPKKMPALTGFWNQDIDSPQQLLFNDEVIGGQVYRVAAVKKLVLFPQQSGALELDPMEAEVLARVQVPARRSNGNGQSNDPFDAFFRHGDPFSDPFGNVQEVRVPLRSLPVKITVRALPQNDVPAEFTGAVGSFSLETTLSPRATKTNEPVKLVVKISGKGNLKLIDPIKLQLPPDIETYDPTTKDNIDVSESGASGTRTFEYLLIPRFAGDFKIPPVSFAYFDLEKKRYTTLQSEEYTLAVEKGKDEAAVVGGKYTQENVNALNSDIRFIKLGRSGERLPRRGEGFYGSTGMFGLLVLPFVLFAGFIFYRRRDEQLRGDVALMKNRSATRIAAKRLGEAKKALASGEASRFHDEISKALWGYMSDKLTIPLANLSRESVDAALKEQNVSEEVRSNFAKTQDTCEFARFAPTHAAGEMQQLYTNAEDIISSLEQALKKK